MEHYISDNQQEEALKQWLRQNGRSIAWGVALGLAIVLGWQGWQGYVDTQGQQASAEYEAVLHAHEKISSEVAMQRGQQLQKDYDKSVYSVLTALQLAKIKADAKEWPVAQAQLQAALDKAPEALKPVIRYRLAQVLWMQGQSQAALALLKEPEPQIAFKGMYEVLKGDIYLEMGDEKAARTAYQQARLLGLTDESLRLKLDNLGG